MNREIKFRGKELGTGKWLYGDLTQWPNGRIDIAVQTDNDREKINYKVLATSVGQFTGLCDCNGKEIYEGDILDCSAVKTIMLEVRYNPKQAAFCLAEHTHTEGVILGTTPLGEMLRHYPNMHIIGNIHDNPELLKGE